MTQEQAGPTTTRPRRRLRRLAGAAAGCLLLFTVIGFLVAPPIARHVAQKQLGDLLGRKVEIGRLRINPFALSLTVGDLRVFEPDGVTPFLGLSRLYVNAELASIVRRGPVIKEIALDSLHVHVVRTKASADSWADLGAAYNFSDIVARLAARPKSPEPPPSEGPPPRFSLNNIHARDLAVVFDDLPSGDHHEMTDLTLGVPFVSTLPVYVDSFVEPGFSVRIDGTPFDIHGRTKPFKDSLETVLELRLQALDLTRYVPFVPFALPVVLASGRLSLALDLAFVRASGVAPKLTVKGAVALAKLDVKEGHKAGGRPLCSLEKLEVRLAEADLTGQRFHVENVLVSGLQVHVHRRSDGVLNLERLARAGRPAEGANAPTRRAPPAPARASSAAPPEPGTGPQFVVDAFSLEKTDLRFRDESVDPAFAAEVRDVEVSVRGLSNAPGATARATVGLRAVPGGILRQEGTVRLTPFAAAGKLSIEGIEPARFAPFYRKLLDFDVVTGAVRLGAGYDVQQTGGRVKARLTDAYLGVADLALRRRAAHDDFFKLGALDVRRADVDLDARSATVGEITTRDGRVRALRDGRGVIDLTTLVVSSPPGASALAATPAIPAPERAPSASGAGRPDAWTVSVSRFDLERWGARFEDRAVTPTAVLSVDPFALHVTNVSTAPGAKVGLDLRAGINKKGRLQISGTSTLPPVTAALRFELRDLEIVPLQPYFQDQVSLMVTDGSVSVKGQVALKLPAVGAPQANVNADIDVKELATVDRGRHEPLLGWQALHVGGLTVGTSPLAVGVGEVSLGGLEAHVALSPDGRLNLPEAFAKPRVEPTGQTVRRPAGPGTAATGNPASAVSAPAPQVSVGRVTLADGRIVFTDQTVHPSFTAEVGDLTGQVTGLSSAGGSPGQVDIQGTLNRSGTLTIAGQANPVAKDLTLDVQVSVKDLELPPASPYTAKYAGYPISKGKLDLALAYKIAGRKLNADNKVVLDQFTFGDKVDSPDAVKLPVRLAVSLLKDRHGVIDVDLPIAGSLDDPQFKVGRAVLKVLGNLVVKAATAPFSLLASAFGGGDELSRIDFAAGAATLDASARKRLAVLGRALQERPAISLEIEGAADPQRDREALRLFLVDRKLKAKKLASLVESGGAAAGVDAITLDSAERPGLVQSVYETERFAKPRNALGFEKRLPPAEMEKLILANTRVENDDLRDLALSRATVVQSALAKAAPTGASRLYLVTPHVAVGGSQVEFRLKKD